MINHDHLCIEPVLGPTGDCLPCMGIATIREDKQWRVIEMMQAPDGSYFEKSRVVSSAQSQY